MFLMIALVVLALLVVGYFYATARVSIAAYKAEGMAASENAALFAQAQEALAEVEQDGGKGRLGGVPAGGQGPELDGLADQGYGELDLGEAR